MDPDGSQWRGHMVFYDSSPGGGEAEERTTRKRKHAQVYTASSSAWSITPDVTHIFLYKIIYLFLSNRHNYCNTYLVLLRVGLAEGCAKS
jgi:hypothetical protein